MCGIVGYISDKEGFHKGLLEKMTQRLAHRGPDGSGTFVEDHCGLGHTRLAILDLHERSLQPMYSENGQYVLVFNGEIYNYKELTEQLGYQPKTASDSEIILAAFEKWHDDCVHHFNGMFSFGIYDKVSKTLKLWRDRMGIKPLYYYWDGTHFAFASELKALLEIPVEKEINKEAINDYLFLEYTPAPKTVIKHFYKLEKGHQLIISNGNIEKKQYYDILGKVKPDEENTSVDTEALEEVLKSSITYRSISDVPVGTFLSGGTDSSLITALFNTVNSDKAKCFSIGFPEKKYDESQYAKHVAEILQCDMNYTQIQPMWSQSLLPGIVSSYDEPFAVPSVIPSVEVCKHAKTNVTVALSGDGGDELFMGYGYYHWIKRMRWLHNIPEFLRSSLSQIGSLAPSRYARIAQVLQYDQTSNHWPHFWSQDQYMFNERDIGKLTGQSYRHESTLSTWQKIENLKVNDFRKVSLFDLSYYLPDNLLYKMDMASMSQSLEVRVPLLDHRVVELAVNMPTHQMIKGNVQKLALKKILGNYLPQSLVHRKKWGFPAPVEYWLKDNLKDVQELLLNSSTFTNHHFDTMEVKKLINAFKSGQHYQFKKIWSLLVLNSWYDKYMKG